MRLQFRQSHNYDFGLGDKFFIVLKSKIFSGPMNLRKGKIAETRRTRRTTITMIEPIGHENENSDTSQKRQILYKKVILQKIYG